MEIWKSIEGFEGMYEISSSGRVRAIRFKKTIILKPQIGSHGYYIVSLHNRKQSCFTIHSLVARAFLGHTPNKTTLVVNHKDGNKLNNDLNNLEIVTHRENIGLLSARKGSSKYVGVSWVRKSRKWRAYIWNLRIGKYLGLYETEESAKEAYDNELKKIENNLI